MCEACLEVGCQRGNDLSPPETVAVSVVREGKFLASAGRFGGSWRGGGGVRVLSEARTGSKRKEELQKKR